MLLRMVYLSCFVFGADANLPERKFSALAVNFSDWAGKFVIRSGLGEASDQVQTTLPRYNETSAN
jgi:hypothetical protein